MEKEVIEALRLKETVESEGFKIFRKIFEEQIQSLDSLKGIESYKQVEARRLAKGALEELLGTVDAIVMNVTLMKASEKPEQEFLRVRV